MNFFEKVCKFFNGPEKPSGWSTAHHDLVSKYTEEGFDTRAIVRLFKRNHDLEVMDNWIDPHYRLMLVYKDAPDWWYGMVLLSSLVVGLVCVYSVNSTIPWWNFLIACALSAICILFFGAQYAITGFQFTIQPIIQMLGGYLHPGYPVAN